MENQQMLLWIVSIVAIVGIVAMVISASGARVALPAQTAGGEAYATCGISCSADGTQWQKCTGDSAWKKTGATCDPNGARLYTI